jgi:hypothetical protein
MQGFLLLCLLGEKIARRMLGQGVSHEEALVWMESWNEEVSKPIRNLDQFSEGVAANLMFKIMTAQRLIDDAKDAADE